MSENKEKCVVCEDNEREKIKIMENEKLYSPIGYNLSIVKRNLKLGVEYKEIPINSVHHLHIIP